MDEQKYKDIMNQLVDKGWADMEKKLDAVMPPGAKKRRRIFPMLILLLISVAVGGSVIYLLSGENSIHQNPEKQLDTSTMDYALQEKSGNEQDLKNQPGPSRVDDNNKQKAQTFNDINSNEKKNQSTSNFQNPDGKINNEQSTWRDEQKPADFAYTEVGSPGSISKKQIPVDGSKNREAASEVLSEVKIVSVAQLIDKKYFTLNWPSQVNSLEIGKVDLALRFTKLAPVSFCRHEFSVQSGMISENLSSLGGFESGISYSRYLTDHLYLSTGLVYKMMNKKQFSNALLKSGLFGLTKSAAAFDEANWVEKRYDYELQNSEIRNNAIGYEYVLGLVNRLHYLDIPVRLGYNWERLGVYGGINVSWMAYGLNAVRDFSQQYFNTIVLSEEVLFNKQMFNRLDVSPQLGLEYKFWQGFTFYSYYNHGLIRIAKADSASKIVNADFEDLYAESPSIRIDRNRYFVLGLKYDLPFCASR